MGMITQLGSGTVTTLVTFGDFCRFSGRTFGWLHSALRPRNLSMVEWMALAEIEQHERVNYAKMSMGMTKWLSQRQ